MFITIAHASNDIITTEQSTAVSPAPEKIEYTWMSSVPYILIFVVFYFLLIRPQEKKRREQLSLLKSLKKGEKVVTAGGIFGIINKINEEDNTIELTVASEINITILKNAISEVINRDPGIISEKKGKLSNSKTQNKIEKASKSA